MSDISAQVTVSPALQAERKKLAEMLDSYLAELGASQVYPYLDLYWEQQNRFPYLIRVGDKLAGFALVRLAESEWIEMAEFCVLRPWRNRAVGRAACSALFGLHPGSWRLSSFPGNRGAGSFWSKVVPANARQVIEGEQVAYLFSVTNSASNRLLDTDPQLQAAAAPRVLRSG